MYKYRIQNSTITKEINIAYQVQQLKTENVYNNYSKQNLSCGENRARAGVQVRHRVNIHGRKIYMYENGYNTNDIILTEIVRKIEKHDKKNE